MSDPTHVSSVQDSLSFQTSTENLFNNPSFELDGAPMSPFQGAGAIVTGWGRTSVYKAWVGSWTYYIAVGSSTAAAFTDQAFLVRPVDATIVPGEKYSASISFRTNNLNAGARLRVSWYAGATFISEENGSYAWATKTDEYRRVRLNGAVAPPNATVARLSFITTGNIANQTYEMATDGWQFENRDGVTTYCDGDQADCVWVGTPHNSHSTRKRIVFEQIRRGRAGTIEIYPELWLSNVNNEMLDNISYAIVDGFVEMDYMRDVKMHAKFETIDEDLVRPYKDYLAPFLKLVYSDGTTERHQLGLYVTEPGKKTFTAETKKVSLEGFDPTYNLLQRSTRSTYKLSHGSNVATAIRSLLNGQGFTRHRIQDTGKTIGKGGRSWPPGTPYLQIINSLCSTAGIYAIFCDRKGVFTSFQYISRKNRKPVKTYVGGEDSVVLEPYEVELIERPYNEIIVYREVNDGESYIGIAQNNNPGNDTNIFEPPVGIGRRSLFINDPDIESNAGALALAREKLEEYGSLEVQATMVTFPEPWHDVHEMYELKLKDTLGRTIPQANGTFWPTSWKIGLSARNARMTHRLKRFIDLGDY